MNKYLKLIGKKVRFIVPESYKYIGNRVFLEGLIMKDTTGTVFLLHNSSKCLNGGQPDPNERRGFTYGYNLGNTHYFGKVYKDLLEAIYRGLPKKYNRRITKIKMHV